MEQQSSNMSLVHFGAIFDSLRSSSFVMHHWIFNRKK